MMLVVAGSAPYCTPRRIQPRGVKYGSTIVLPWYLACFSLRKCVGGARCVGRNEETPPNRQAWGIWIKHTLIFVTEGIWMTCQRGGVARNARQEGFGNLALVQCWLPPNSKLEQLELHWFLSLQLAKIISSLGTWFITDSHDLHGMQPSQGYPKYCC